MLENKSAIYGQNFENSSVGIPRNSGKFLTVLYGNFLGESHYSSKLSCGSSSWNDMR